MTAFLATDRCDRCGAQAHASATLPSGVLLLCGHHYREHWESLLLADADIVLDDTLRLVNVPAPGTTPTPRATTSGDAGHQR